MFERLDSRDRERSYSTKKILAGLGIFLAASPLAACTEVEGMARAAQSHVDVAAGPNLVVGDSLTVELYQGAKGMFAPEFAQQNGLPYGIPHDGAYKGGATSSDIQRMLRKRNLLARNYEAAVVEVGINDVLPKNTVQGVVSDGYTDQDRRNITELYENIAAKSECVVAVLPSYDADVLDVAYFGTGKGIRIELDRLRADMHTIVIPELQGQGIHVEVADPHPYIQMPGSTSNDGIHARPLFEAVPPETGSAAFHARTNTVVAALDRC